LFGGSFDLCQKRTDMAVVLQKAAEKAVIYQVPHLKKAFVMEENGEHVIKVAFSLVVIPFVPFFREVKLILIIV
jgi:hypothetical protein